MHDTARCLGYPSDSTRAARERAREATCGLPPARVWSGHNLSGYCILALASAAQLLARVARLFTIDALILARDAQPVTYCARVAQLLAVWLALLSTSEPGGSKFVYFVSKFV